MLPSTWTSSIIWLWNSSTYLYGLYKNIKKWWVRSLCCFCYLLLMIRSYFLCRTRPLASFYDISQATIRMDYNQRKKVMMTVGTDRTIRVSFDLKVIVFVYYYHWSVTIVYVSSRIYKIARLSLLILEKWEIPVED